MRKRVAILGSTGSIGILTLDVIREFRERFEIKALSAFKNYELLLSQAEEFGVKRVCIVDRESYEKAKTDRRAKKFELLEGENGIIEIAIDSESEIIVNAIVGSGGLLATINALEAGKRVCLANKESLVCAGKYIVELLKKKGELFPIDSEHSAVFQAMKAGKHSELKRIILTASGGPLWQKKNEVELSPDEAVNHPRWRMGKKISVDSATMLNKGFELIEAHWLFGLPYEKIDVLIHPESIVHSLVEFVDNSIISQLSYPDMRIPIQYALLYPERLNSKITSPLDLATIRTLTFYEPPSDKYPSLQLSREIAKKSGNLPAALVGADDIIVSAFLDGKIKFSQIVPLLKEVVQNIKFIDNPTLTEILSTIENAKNIARKLISSGFEGVQ